MSAMKNYNHPSGTNSNPSRVSLLAWCLIIYAAYPVSSLPSEHTSYRITNAVQGVCRSLQGAKSTVLLQKTTHSSSQFWRLAKHPTQANTFQLVTTQQGALTMGYKGALGLISPFQGAHATQYWSFKDCSGMVEPGDYIRFSNLQTKEYLASLGAADDEIHLVPTNSTDERTCWRLREIESVQKPPGRLELDQFYKKYLNMSGIPIISSQRVPNKALYQVYHMADHMLSNSPETLRAMVEHNARIAIIAQGENTTTIPEHRFLKQHYGDYWDKRARGFGGTVRNPVASCAEENILCYPKDKWSAQDIFIHEFAHSINLLGLAFAFPEFKAEIERLYENALAQGLYKNTYAATNTLEYFAEGVQSWFNVNHGVEKGNGINNWVNLRHELQQYDPGLYSLLAKYFPSDPNKCSCH